MSNENVFQQRDGTDFHTGAAWLSSARVVRGNLSLIN